MIRPLVLVCVLALLAGPAAAQRPGPDAVRIETADVRRFVEMMDALRAASTYDDSLAVVTERYFEAGSPGLRDWIRVRIGSAARLLDVMRARPAYYAHLRTSLAGLASAEPRIREAFRRFEAMYPDAVFTDVYFVVGRMNSGGTTSADKILLGAEMFGLDDAAPRHELGEWERTVLRDPAALETVAVHELMHINQPSSGRDPTLLQAALLEGGADFVTGLVTGENVNAHVHDWANPRERELWAEFRARMNESDLSGWLYGGGGDDRPADLGYWIGYRIARAYYERAADRRAAIGEILRATDDAEAFLARSGYAGPARR